ncbi:MAG TPA: hypothetical protein VM261_36800 [Kofleriaceae bacterium]|nr:hypothetical protein [Kofleriaceae bacterium]
MSKHRRLPLVLVVASTAVAVAACGSKKDAPAAGSGVATSSGAPPAPTVAVDAPPAPAVDAAPAEQGAVDLECVDGAHYKVELKWKTGAKCSLGPESLKKLSFKTTHFPDKLSELEASLDDGVMKDSSSPYYEESMTVEKVDGCKITVKLEQPPSHQTWAFLHLELTVDGKKLSGTAAYDQSEEGETCEASATVSGTFEEIDISG